MKSTKTSGFEGEAWATRPERTNLAPAVAPAFGDTATFVGAMPSPAPRCSRFSAERGTLRARATDAVTEVREIGAQMDRELRHDRGDVAASRAIPERGRLARSASARRPRIVRRRCHRQNGTNDRTEPIDVAIALPRCSARRSQRWHRNGRMWPRSRPALAISPALEATMGIEPMYRALQARNRRRVRPAQRVWSEW